MKKILFLFTCLLFSSMVFAQDKLEGTVATDVVTTYYWRGQNCGDVSLQPTLGVAYRGLSLSAWGSVGLSNAEDTKEFDLTLSYSTGGLTLGVTDYWFNSGLDSQNRYFMYNAHSTNHVFEAFAGYDFGPLSATWFTNFAGNDGVGSGGKRAYSSYAEVAVPFRLASIDWSAQVGVVPYATSYYDTTGFAVTNLSLKATKDIRITDSFSVPVFGQVAANPCAEKAYLVFGFTLQP